MFSNDLEKKSRKTVLNTRAAAPTPIVRWAVILTILVCTALVAVNVWLLIVARKQVINQVTSTNVNLAASIAQQVDGSVYEVEHILDGLVFEFERAELSERIIVESQPVLVNHSSGIGQIKGLFVYDAVGKWLVTSESMPNSGMNNSDREYFAFHRNNGSREAYLGRPIISRSSGRWVVPLSRRINNHSGEFAGVVLATLDVNYYQQILTRFNVGKNGAIAITSRDRLLLRVPYSPLDTGREVPQSALTQLLGNEQSGATDFESPFDGVRRIIGFDHAKNYPILVTVATSRQTALDNWRSGAYYQSAIVFVVCMGISIGGFLFVRSIKRRLTAEAKLHEAYKKLTDANERLTHLALEDGLTGIANRGYFNSRLKQSFASAQREKRLLAVILIDIDEFKKYNDLYGHVAGDLCLKTVASALKEALRRPADLVARYGGEEIVMLLPETDLGGAHSVAEQARISVWNLNIPHGATSHGRITVSVGVASWTPSLGDSAVHLVEAADAALYKAKNAGRNRVMVDGREFYGRLKPNPGA